MKRGGCKFGDSKTRGCPLSKKGGCSIAVGTQTQKVSAPPPPPGTSAPLITLRSLAKTKSHSPFRTFQQQTTMKNRREMSTPGHPDMAPVELPVTCQANPMQLPVGLKHHGLMREEGGGGREKLSIFRGVTRDVIKYSCDRGI